MNQILVYLQPRMSKIHFFNSQELIDILIHQKYKFYYHKIVEPSCELYISHVTNFGDKHKLITYLIYYISFIY